MNNIFLLMCLAFALGFAGGFVIGVWMGYLHNASGY